MKGEEEKGDKRRKKRLCKGIWNEEEKDLRKNGKH